MTGGAETRELTREERAAIRKLVTGMCANYDRDCGCLPLDYGGCYMLNKWWTGSYCKYFQNAVLPLDPMLEATLTGREAPAMEACAICGKPIHAANNRAKYCAACADAARRKRQREYMRKKKGGI
jgi:ribosomal protein L37E